MLTMRSAAPFFGVIFWVLSIRAGTLATALLPPPKTGYGSKTISRVYPSLDDLGIEITQRDLNDSVDFAKSIINSLKRLETNLGWSDIAVKAHTPSYGMYINFRPEGEAVRKAMQALIATKASLQLMNTFCHKHNLNHKDCARYLTDFKFDRTPLEASCKLLKRRCSPEEYLSPYRSADGYCNHIYSAVKGQSLTAYNRLLSPDYLDGVIEPRRATNKKALPSSRFVSGALVKYTERPDELLTSAVMHWGQFVEHDLSKPVTSIMVHTGKPIECCASSGNNLSPRYIHPFCYPITVPSDDEYYSDAGLDCMNYVRSVVAIRPDCSFGPGDQVNQATHYLDGSQIYGSDGNTTGSLRAFSRGKLNTSTFAGKAYLPLSGNPTHDCQVGSSSSVCFKSGDSRVNFQPELTALHTLWYREHNRIAGELAKFNPLWDDEELFQEARRIVIAEMQHITYNEWLGKVLAKMYIGKIARYSEYDESEDPSVSNSFATAAMRSIKSLYDGKIKLVEEDRKSNTTIGLERYFNNPEIIQRPEALDALVRGLATHQSQKIDVHYPKALVNQLYSNGDIGFDILSVDIQRGRDHGLPSYVHYRTLCGLPEAEEFDHFVDVMPQRHIDALAKVYASYMDVDLIVGGLMELPEGDSLFGPTFSCIIADQFRRTKKGDRYFYTNKHQPKPFGVSQLNEIKKVTLARVFCDNTDGVEKMQPNVFEQIGDGNELVDCDGSDIPRMNLAPWKESRERYYH